MMAMAGCNRHNRKRRVAIEVFQWQEDKIRVVLRTKSDPEFAGLSIETLDNTEVAAGRDA